MCGSEGLVCGSELMCMGVVDVWELGFNVWE